jgi:hypothetical protein
VRKADSVYVLLCAFKMFKMIEHPSDCEIQSVIHFLNARNVKPAEIHHQICEVYGENAISDGMVRKWVRKFNEGRDKVHTQAAGRPAVCAEWCLHRQPCSTRRGYRNWCPIMINALIMVETM